VGAEGLTRLRDDELERLAVSRQRRISSMATELLQARERGLMPTVDLATELLVNRIPVEMKDGTYVAIPEAALHVCAWTPEEGGKGKTTQVHLQFEAGEGVSFVHRMKSGPAVDQLIILLAEYRAEVWPQYRGVRVR